MITSKTYNLLNSLRDFQLHETFVHPIEWSIRFNFSFGSDPTVRDMVIKLSEVVHFLLSKDSDDNEGCYTVYETTLTELEDGGKEVLSSLSYPIKSTDGNVFCYPSKTLFHFHLEGDLCVEVVCGKYEVFQCDRDRP